MCACVYMCFFNLFREGGFGPSQVYAKPVSRDRSTRDKAQQMTR